MNWDVKKLKEIDSSSFLTFEIVKKDEKGEIKKETKKENTFSYQARMFIKNFEGFSKIKDEPKNHKETATEKEERENTAYAYYDSEGIPTIGYGFNLKNEDAFDAVFDMIFAGLLESDCNSHALDICNILKAKNINLGDLGAYSYQQCKNLTSKFKRAFWAGKWKNKKEKGESDQILQDKIQKAIKEYLHTERDFSLTNQQAQNIFASLLDKKINTIAKARETTRENIVKSFLGSNEGIALLSLYYNNPNLIGEGLKSAYMERNRFKMWFEIRYRSNGGNSIGIAKRRFAESNIFGLFENTKRGGYSNTADWGFVNNENTNKAELKETIKFFSFLHSKFEKEGKKSCFEYLKHYESGKFFGKTTISDKLDAEKKENKPDLQHHFIPHTKLFSPFINTFNGEMANAKCSYNFDIESIFVVNKDNRTSIIETINASSKKGELAILIEESVDIGFYNEIHNINTLHILLSFDNHIDCLGFESAKKMIFYVLKDDRIIKLCGCKEALKPQEFSLKDKTLKGLMQVNQDEEIIYCFKELPSGEFSPNLSIYDRNTFELLATIYNLRSEGSNDD